jgi:hypothetical protein
MFEKMLRKNAWKKIRAMKEANKVQTAFTVDT